MDVVGDGHMVGSPPENLVLLSGAIFSLFPLDSGLLRFSSLGFPFGLAEVLGGIEEGQQEFRVDDDGPWRNAGR